MLPDKIGRYEIRKEIERGGMSKVYLAQDPSFERDVAIKVLPRELLEDPQFRTRFEREAKFIASVEHTAIVPVYDLGEHAGQPYLVMRYMQGGSLRDRLQRGPLSLDESETILRRVVSALEHAHKRGIIHRDLKPGNILFDDAGEAYLTDFGIAKRASTSVTLTGSMILGTPAYMSPEQARGEPGIDSRTDIYALGAILFEMLTGRVPYEADTPTGQMLRHITDPVPNIREIRKDLPAECQKVIERSMAKNPQARYANAGEFIQAIQEFTLPKKPTRPRREASQVTAAAVPPKPARVQEVAPPAPAGQKRGRLWMVALPLAAVFLIVVCVGLGSLASSVIKNVLARANPGATLPPASTSTIQPPLAETGLGSVRFVGTRGGDLFRGLEEASSASVLSGAALQAGPETRLWTRQGGVRLALGDGATVILADDTAVWVDNVTGPDSDAQETDLRLEKGALLFDASSVAVQSYQDRYQAGGTRAIFGVLYEAQRGRFLIDCLSGVCRVGLQGEPDSLVIPVGQRGGYEGGSRIDLEDAQESLWRELAGGEIDWRQLPTATLTPRAATDTPAPTLTPTLAESTPSPTPTIAEGTPVPSPTRMQSAPKPTATQKPNKPRPSPTQPPPPGKKSTPTQPPP